MVSCAHLTLQPAYSLAFALSGFVSIAAACAPTDICKRCKTFDAIAWCYKEGAGQCTGSGPKCSSDDGGNACFFTEFVATALPQSITIPVRAFRDNIAGLDKVLVWVQGGSALAATNVALLFDGKNAACEDFPVNGTTGFFRRCAVPPDLGQLQIVSSGTGILFDVNDVKFFEPACKDIPPYCAN